MEVSKQEAKNIGLYFRISILLKGAFSMIEMLAGVVVLFVPVSYFTNLVIKAAQEELIEEPGSFIATHSLQFATHFSVGSTFFVAFYLISRGLIKFGLIIALLKNKLWAYPLSLAVLGMFVAYQVYQIAISSSLFLIALTLFDLIVMWFIWKEYELVKKRG